MADTRDVDVILRFNRNINERDLEGVSQLLADDHTFIDVAGAAITGKAACLRAWQAFFRQFPDYRNVFENVVTHEGRVAIAGRSTCSDPRLHGPALWTARVVDGLVREWRVHADTPAARRELGLGPEAEGRP